MICPRCTLRLSLHPARFPISLRTLTTTTALLQPENPPPATSTSAAQPFSTPFTPSPTKTPGIPSSPNATLLAPARPAFHTPSSVPAGTPLRGLGYIKGKEAPVAREDSEYPEWLWGLLDKKTEEVEAEGAVGDAFAKSKKKRRLASKAARALKTGTQGSTHIVRVPLEEQSIDLPSGMGEEEGQRALEAREELTGAMRAARRRKIKENNYLRGMN